jgi:small subunit ribosomal protein S9
MSKAKAYEVHTVGRRKSSVARVYVTRGSGKVTINSRDVAEYFPMGTSRVIVFQPLELLKARDSYDFTINVQGGGVTGQAGAIRLGISRALLKLTAGSRPELKKAGFLTRDPRKVERKKYGKHGARRSCQFSKR